MFYVVLSLLFLLGAFILWRRKEALKVLGVPGWIRTTLVSSFVILAVFLMANTSYVFVGSNEVGHMKKVYLGSSLPKGRILATNGQMGFQSKILSPGFHFSPFLRVIYDIELKPIVEIPKGYYGLVSTADGKPLPFGQVMAAPWADSNFANMLDATYFLTKGNGYKGLQTSVLKPGKYRLNLYQYNVQIVGTKFMERYNSKGKQEWGSKENLSAFNKTTVTLIPAGFVGVIKSNVQTNAGAKCNPIKVSISDGSLSAPLVPRGCKGVWVKPLFPGAYFLNREAYNITLVDTRVQTWSYKGGYIRREFNLSVNQDGTISQKETSEVIPIPKTAADGAIRIKVQGWDIPLELSVIIQVDPKDAPVVVASVGNLSAVEDKVMTPLIRSNVRNVVGAYKKVFALQDERTLLEKNIEASVKPEGFKYGITIKEVRLREPYLPPELRVARLRAQLASELEKTFKTEQNAQIKRIDVEKARATADQQPALVKAEIAVQVAVKFKERRKLEGEAQRSFLTAVAAGEKERASVLGAERVMVINIVKEVLSTLERQPKILTDIKWPQTFVSGGGGLAGMAAILGKSFGRGVLPSVTKQ